ncbi:MAG TPA: hypothetical protein VLW08_06690 [Casimicrobiaceae bacterium]|jgi:hypothetical protein|nr:hypothetical protein [Casimicrobiaceae bacterium]
MKLQYPSCLNADFGLVVVLAAMLAVGMSAMLLAGAEPASGEHGIATQVAAPRAAAEIGQVVPYRVEVVGVRVHETAQGDTAELRARRERSG